MHVSPEARHYIVDLVGGTRTHPEIALGASPRAALHLIRAARARAALDQRGFVLPDDVQEMAVPVMAHRLLLQPEIMLSGEPTIEVAARILTDVLRRIPILRPGTARPTRHGR